MMKQDDIGRIREMAVRGRLALALTGIERALGQCQVYDERIRELVDALWAFVERHDLFFVEDAALQTGAADLLDAYEFGQPIPGPYGDLPPFLPEMLFEALSIARAHMFASISGYGRESFSLTVRVLELCQQNGTPIPDIASFPFLSFTDEEGWGKPTPRSVFADIPNSKTEGDVGYLP